MRLRSALPLSCCSPRPVQIATLRSADRLATLDALFAAVDLAEHRGEADGG